MAHPLTMCRCPFSNLPIAKRGRRDSRAFEDGGQRFAASSLPCYSDRQDREGRASRLTTSTAGDVSQVLQVVVVLAATAGLLLAFLRAAYRRGPGCRFGPALPATRKRLSQMTEQPPAELASKILSSPIMKRSRTVLVLRLFPISASRRESASALREAGTLLRRLASECRLRAPHCSRPARNATGARVL